MRRIVNEFGKLTRGKKGVRLFCGVCCKRADCFTARTLTMLDSFAGNPTEGACPFAGLVQATNGTYTGPLQLMAGRWSREVLPA
jgi:hypothetical protein